MARTPHLTERLLFDTYLAQQAGQPLDPPTAEHLADCAACAAEFADLVSLMQAVRSAGESDADRVFTPERLRAQQQEIARRIEHVGRSARVISFPGHAQTTRAATPAPRSAPRWIAAAAAAGLFFGAALGASYQWQIRSRGPAALRVARQGGAVDRRAHVSAVATRGIGPAPSAADEDAFLSDLEAALARPRTRELQPFDTLTPHVRDVSMTGR